MDSRVTILIEEMFYRSDDLFLKLSEEMKTLFFSLDKSLQNILLFDDAISFGIFFFVNIVSILRIDWELNFHR